MLKSILVATDGSANGHRAVLFATSLARERGASLVFCNAIDAVAAIAPCAGAGGLGSDIIVKELEDAAVTILARESEPAKQAGLHVTKVAPFGRPADTIVTYAADHDSDAIVVGTQGKRGLERFFLGSTAADVLRHSDVPVFVIPPECTSQNVPLRRLLVAIDGSEASDAAFDFALELAAPTHASIVLCNVIDTRDLHDTDREVLLRDADALLRTRGEIAAAHGLAHELSVAEGEPSRAIVTAAKTTGADAILIGTHGRSGLQRLFLGSVAESVSRDAEVPVAVVRALRRARAQGDGKGWASALLSP
jgi:nucleotide-binding universal stress UspA family protein